ncbi:hypothetical protein J7M28_05270 [bacterium]|nr:hypothetical protein [bacterium]
MKATEKRRRQPGGPQDGTDTADERPDSGSDDPEAERHLEFLVLMVLLFMLLCVLIIPGSWLNSASMWFGAHVPGL